MTSRDNADFGTQTAQTLDRGLAILEELADGDYPLGASVSELAGALGLARPVVYRLLASLALRDFVVRAPDGRVRLGMALPRLADRVLPTVRASAIPLLRRLADETGATAHLTVAEAGEARALVVVEPRASDMHVSYRVGSRHALEQGAAGRAILRARSGDTSYVLSEGELQVGAWGIAAAVPGLGGLEASVGVVSLRRFDDEPLVGAAVHRCAASLAAELGGTAQV